MECIPFCGVPKISSKYYNEKAVKKCSAKEKCSDYCRFGTKPTVLKCTKSGWDSLVFCGTLFLFHYIKEKILPKSIGA